jgi:hypothetical protein
VLRRAVNPVRFGAWGFDSLRSHCQVFRRSGVQAFEWSETDETGETADTGEQVTCRGDTWQRGGCWERGRPARMSDPMRARCPRSQQPAGSSPGGADHGPLVERSTRRPVTAEITSSNLVRAVLGEPWPKGKAPDWKSGGVSQPLQVRVLLVPFSYLEPWPNGEGARLLSEWGLTALAGSSPAGSASGCGPEVEDVSLPC